MFENKLLYAIEWEAERRAGGVDREQNKCVSVCFHHYK